LLSSFKFIIFCAIVLQKFNYASQNNFHLVILYPKEIIFSQPKDLQKLTRIQRICLVCFIESLTKISRTPINEMETNFFR
jgi:hypothetical protein